MKLFLQKITVAACVSISLFQVNLSFAQQTATSRVGVLAFADPSSVAERWQPTITRLEQELQRPFELVALTPDQLDSSVAQGKLDFLITNALTGVSYKKDFGTTSLLTLVPRDGHLPTQSVGSALVTRVNQKVDDYGDLTSLDAVSTDKQAFGGFQILAGEMAHNHLNPFKDFNSLEFVGFPQQKLLQLVANGEADVAILPTCVLENAIANGYVASNSLKVVLTKPTTGFNCLTSSELYPYYSFSKLGKTDHRLATEVVKVLLDIQFDEQAAVIGRYTAWSATVNDSRVFTLLKQLQQWPFVTNWTTIFKNAMPWATVLAVLLFLGYLHHLRVKRLVVLRTQDLQDEIGQHTQTQKALLEQTKQFYKAQRVLLTGEMASGIAHELNQPLAGIRYLTQGCIYRLSNEQTELKEAMLKAIQQVDRAQSTIKRFRNFCQQPSVMKQCQLDQVLEETLSLMAPEFLRIQLTPELEIEPAKLIADASLLQQVFVNIIRNALDAMIDSVTPYLAIALSNSADGVIISFKDHGSGLSEAALERLFFPFETSKDNGLGLGMIICKRIIEEHSGEISAINNAIAGIRSPGLTITIFLPTKEAEID